MSSNVDYLVNVNMIVESISPVIAFENVEKEILLFCSNKELKGI